MRRLITGTHTNQQEQSVNIHITILGVMLIYTERGNSQQTDIVVKDSKEKKCMIINVAVPSECNTSVKVIEKLSKYKDLEIKMSRMWVMKTKTMPVVI